MAISDEAIGVLATELGELLTGPFEFDEIYFERIDHATALVLQTRRGQRTCGYRFPDLTHVDLDAALKSIRWYYSRREVN